MSPTGRCQANADRGYRAARPLRLAAQAGSLADPSECDAAGREASGQCGAAVPGKSAGWARWAVCMWLSVWLAAAVCRQAAATNVRLKDGRVLKGGAAKLESMVDRNGCRERVELVLGRSGIVRDEHFRPATPRDIAARVLRNLKASYVMRNGWPQALLVQERLSQLLHEERTEQRDLGLLCLRNGQPQRALRLLTAYTADCDEAEARELQPYLRSARRLLFEMN